jgi:hypothetical protein
VLTSPSTWASAGTAQPRADHRTNGARRASGGSSLACRCGNSRCWAGERERIRSRGHLHTTPAVRHWRGALRLRQQRVKRPLALSRPVLYARGHPERRSYSRLARWRGGQDRDRERHRPRPRRAGPPHTPRQDVGGHSGTAFGRMRQRLPSQKRLRCSCCPSGSATLLGHRCRQHRSPLPCRGVRPAGAVPTIRPICLPAYSVNQSAPSDPAVIPSGELVGAPLARLGAPLAVGRGNSLTWPLVVIRPIPLRPPSEPVTANQSAPSGPVVIPSG